MYIPQKKKTVYSKVVDKWIRLDVVYRCSSRLSYACSSYRTYCYYRPWFLLYLERDGEQIVPRYACDVNFENGSANLFEILKSLRLNIRSKNIFILCKKIFQKTLGPEKWEFIMIVMLPVTYKEIRFSMLEMIQTIVKMDIFYIDVRSRIVYRWIIHHK